MAQPSFPLPDYLKAQEALFRAATRQLQSRSAPQSLSEAAEWLPDNFYLVQQTCRQIREDMPASFYRQLPKRDAGPLQGFPRVYAVAQKLIVMRQARLDLAHITRFVQLYQDFAATDHGRIVGAARDAPPGAGRVSGAKRQPHYRSAPRQIRCPR